MKWPPYSSLIGFPMPFVGIVLYGYSKGIITSSDVTLWIWAGVIAIAGWGGAILRWLIQNKLVAQRLVIDIEPSVIKTMDGAVVYKPFSSSTRFLSDAEAFDKAVTAVASRPQFRKGRFVKARESVHARLWPGELSVSKVEAERIQKCLAVQFVNPVVEVVGSSDTTSSANRA